MGLKFGCGSFLNSTNNRLESVNGKLKQVITRHSSLEEFIEHFFIILTALRTERDHKAALIFQKVKVSPYSADSPEAQYSQLLTPYAYKFVQKQLALVDKVKEIEESSGVFTIKTSEGVLTVSSTNCTCIFRTSMLLPCRHMLAFRKEIAQPLFCANLCDRRWTSEYYKDTQRLFTGSSSSVEASLVMTASKQHRRKLSQHDKFRKASLLTSELASVASGTSGIHFDRRIELLKDLISYWKRGDEVSLVEVEEGI